MHHRTEGIVLKNFPYGEADLIVTYLTKDLGIIRAFAKSPRKTKSRFGSSLEPLTCTRIALWGKEDASLPRLTQSDILFPFQGVRDSLACFLKMSESLELTLSIIPERDTNRNAYSLLLSTLQELEKNCGSALLLLQYKVKLLGIAGYLPRLDGCGRCGKNGSCFYFSHGSVLCETCSRRVETSLEVSPAVVQVFSRLLAWDPAKLGRIRPSEQVVSGLSSLLDEHIRYIIERDLKTKAFQAI